MRQLIGAQTEGQFAADARRADATCGKGAELLS